MLSTEQLTAMREQQEATMQDTCTIGRRTYVTDNMGGQTEVITYAESVVRVAASGNMPDYSIFAARANESQLWRLTFPYNTDVRDTDKIVVGARTFEVLGVLAPATYETARVTVCVEL